MNETNMYFKTNLGKVSVFALHVNGRVVLKMQALVYHILAAVASLFQCPSTDVERLYEGCSYLRGLSETSVRGTTVDDYNCGLVVPVTEFALEPLFQYPLARSKRFYTLFLLDPDVNTYKFGEFFLHLLKSNIPGYALKWKTNGTVKGDDYQPYFSPMPTPGSGLHRYISVLFEQADGSFRPDVIASRMRFRLADFLAGTTLCGPVAGTQFLTQIAL